MFIRSRREFMRNVVSSVSAAGALGGLAKFGEMNALAANSVSPGYKALVCIFLAGGNDGHNTVIPITTAQQNYSLYQQGRGGLALSQASLAPVNNGNDVYGLHPRMVEIANLYNQATSPVAIVSNVGMLVQPMDRNSYASAGSSLVPNALFSHSDQQSQWQSAVPTGLGSTGWGGRIADIAQIQSLNSGAAFPAATSTSGSSLFCTGAQSFPAVVPPGGTPILSASAAATAGLQQVVNFSNGMQMVQAANSNTTRGVNYATLLTNALNGVTITTPFPAAPDNAINPLAQQLRTVAAMIKVQSTLGIGRQIFFCTLGGFDTHGGQLSIQDYLLQELSQSVAAFYQCVNSELGAGSQVTTFTASEFGRTLTGNSSGGTDHAWGNHHFVIGGAVKGGQFYGQYPSLALGSLNDTNQRGTLIPTTSVDQYAATLAQWFGVPAGASMSSIFQNLGNFQNSNLGFV